MTGVLMEDARAGDLPISRLVIGCISQTQELAAVAGTRTTALECPRADEYR